LFVAIELFAALKVRSARVAEFETISQGGAWLKSATRQHWPVWCSVPLFGPFEFHAKSSRREDLGYDFPTVNFREFQEP